MFGLNLLQKTAQQEFCTEQLNAWEKRYDTLVDDYNALLEQMNNTANSSDVSVNFANENIFSIERVFDDDDVFRTIIGYFDKNGKAREWYLHISSEKHEELVQQFNTANNIKKG